jgi:RNA polymerase sigma-70 factor (ECF subfamily)
VSRPPGISNREAQPAATGLPVVAPELRAAFLVALERRRGQLERLAMSIIRCQEDAEDVVQESVVKALRFLPRFRGDALIDTWLHAIVLNTARDWLRVRRQRVRISLDAEPEERDEAGFPELSDPGETPEDSCGRRELMRHLREEIRRLDPMYQMPILLCDLDGRSYCEAASILKISGPAMKARLFRARVMLKRRLQRHSCCAGFSLSSRWGVPAGNRGSGRQQRRSIKGNRAGPHRSSEVALERCG